MIGRSILMGERCNKYNKEDVARLLEFGELVYTLESICLDADNEANKFEYVPIGDGKFINSKGDIVTHQEMEEYFMDKYGYFIDLYNGYRVIQRVNHILYLEIHNYKMIADTIRGYDKLIDGRYNKNVNTLIEYVNKVAGDNIDKDAINDILVEYTAPKYSSRKRRK